MSRLIDELRKKYQTPQAAMLALGLDASLLEGGNMPNTALVRAAVARGALLAYLRPKLAMDARPRVASIIDSVDVTVDPKAIVAAVRAVVKDRLAQDASIEDLPELLEALAREEGPGEEEDMEPNAGVPMAVEHVRAMRGPPSAADLRHIMDLLGHDEETEEEKREREVEDRRRAEDRASRAADARRTLGRDETLEECDRRERAADARDRLGRDESEEERLRREKEEAEGRDKRANDARTRLGRDESAEERREREAEDRARDRRRADDRRRAEDRKRAADARRRSAMDRHRAATDRRPANGRRVHDQPPPFEGRPTTGGTMDKRAMDAAIDARVAERVAEVERRHAAYDEAVRYVRPWLGEMALDAAVATADDVFRAALAALGEDVRDVHPSAYRAILSRLPKPGAARQPALAMDTASVDAFAKNFPNAARIREI